ncbi:hypothetical protein SAMN04515695_6083 [Pseudovibrio sp. Tun.PSC04-5.I4]|nr:hypothetical protein SAMN04515695_6083 [Pseudovibrio sp. Tun.PSC04-5.I4]
MFCRIKNRWLRRLAKTLTYLLLIFGIFPALIYGAFFVDSRVCWSGPPFFAQQETLVRSFFHEIYPDVQQDQVKITTVQVARDRGEEIAVGIPDNWLQAKADENAVYLSSFDRGNGPLFLYYRPEHAWNVETRYSYQLPHTKRLTGWAFFDSCGIYLARFG